MSLQRGRNGRGHRLGIRARQARIDIDGRIIDRGQIADRKRFVTNQAEQNDAHHHQRSGDGTMDKQLREAVALFLFFQLNHSQRAAGVVFGLSRVAAKSL